MSFPYKRILLVGGTAGIGASMADRLIEDGAKVIAVGRRQERLDQFVAKHGEDKAGQIQFDITNTAGLDNVVERVTKAYPDLDCIFLNAGIQKPFMLAEPQFSLEEFHHEVDVNFTSIVNVTMKFLPFLMQKDTEAGVIFTGSNVAIIPLMSCPGYSSSKAALNAFTLCLREHLRDTKVRVIEISPPPVQSELHDYIGPEWGRAFGMPTDQYTRAALECIKSGSDQVVHGAPAGGTREEFLQILDGRRQYFDNLSAYMRKFNIF